MSDVTKEISVLVRLRGGAAFQAEAGAVSRSIKGIGAAADDSKLKSLSTHFNKWGNSLMGIGRSLLPVSAGIAGIGYEAGKTANTFQKNMTLLMTQANMPRKAVQGLRKDIMDLSTTMGQTPSDLAAAAYWPASGGPNQQRQIASILKYASMGAGIGQDSVDQNAKAMSQIMSTGYYANNPRGLMSLMDTAVGQGHMHLSDLMDMTGTGIVPVLKKTGMSLKQLYATIAALTSTGVSPTSAASRLRLTFSSMVSPTGVGQKALAGVGLNNYALANDLKRGGLIQAVQDMMVHGQEHGYGSNQMNTLMASVFSRSRGWASIASVMDMLPRIQQILKLEGKGNGGRFNQHWNEFKNTFQFQLNKVKATTERALIPLGTVILKDLIPVLKNLSSILGSLTKWFTHLSPGVQKTVVEIGAFIAILGPFLIVLGSVFRVFGLLFMVVGRVWSVLVFLAGIASTVGEVFAMVAGIVGVSVGAVVAVFVILIAAIGIVVFIFRKQLWGAIKAVAGVIGGVFLHLWRDLKGVVSDLLHPLRMLKDAIHTVLKVVGDVTHPGRLLSGAVHMITHPWSLIPGLASGGTVTGSGLTWVGERGPELLDLPRGATVTPLTGNGMANLKASFGDGTGITLQNTVVLDGKVIATSVDKVHRNRSNRK